MITSYVNPSQIYDTIVIYKEKAFGLYTNFGRRDISIRVYYFNTVYCDTKNSL